MNQTTIPALPEYVCHKKVRAARICAIIPAPTDGSRMVDLTLELPDLSTLRFRVTLDFIKKHNPMPGWYLVVYEDGYHSASPGPVFEAGYSRAPDPQPITYQQIQDRAFVEGVHWTPDQLRQLKASGHEIRYEDSIEIGRGVLRKVGETKVGVVLNPAVDIEFPAGSQWKAPPNLPAASTKGSILNSQSFVGDRDAQGRDHGE